MNVLDLFSGIGGFSLGLERSGGFRTVACCEIDPYARSVLARHWPGVKIYADVRSLTAGRLAADGIAVDVITAGFPCQDISVAGRGAGLDAERSGLWRHVIRLAGELRPRYIVMENVPALLVRGLGTILADLAALGFDAEWHCIPAAAVGAPHRRDRLWIVAYADCRRRAGLGLAQCARQQGTPGHQPHRCGERGWRKGAEFKRDWWDTEPDVGRVAHGIPARVDRLRCLGNAIVPQIAELIGRAILAREEGP